MRFFMVFLLCLSLEAQKVEFDYELDAYYSNISAFVNLDENKTIKDGTKLSELQIYSQLLYHSLHPNIFLVEASINPMPIVGLYIRKDNEELYEKSDRYNFNLVKVVTAGFEEPYALSFFVGRMMVFKRKKLEHIGENRAYLGFLCSVGDRSIKDNLLYKNRWYELELKLKGTREKEFSSLDWSFRVGSRIHENKDFVDSLYFGIRRSRIDYNKDAFSFIYNSAYRFLIEFDKKNLRPIKSEIILEKKIPLSSLDKVVFGLEIGYIHSSIYRYNNDLRDKSINNNQFIFRPNLKF